ncbi:MAG: exodeoxyribonuclease VII large subunit, partial [Sphingomicrobium sp.]
LGAAWRMAQLAHPERPLKRGFARVTSRDRRTLVRASDAREAGALTLHFGDGTVDAIAQGTAGADGVAGSAARPPPVERKPRKSYIAPQPGLFDAPEE